MNQDRIVRGKLILSPVKRFWAKIKKTETCWIWNGSLTVDGYGQMKCGDGPVRANRFSWELHVGKIPDGLCVLHKCDNPDHLFLGTKLDNGIDMANKGRAGSPHSKLSEADVRMAKLLSGKISQSKIGHILGVDQSAISRAVNNKTYQHESSYHQR